MPDDHLGTVPRTDPISLLTIHGAKPWYGDDEWRVGLLDAVTAQAERAREAQWPLVTYVNNWGKFHLGTQ